MDSKDKRITFGVGSHHQDVIIFDKEIKKRQKEKPHAVSRFGHLEHVVGILFIMDIVCYSEQIVNLFGMHYFVIKN